MSTPNQQRSRRKINLWPQSARRHIGHKRKKKSRSAFCARTRSLTGLAAPDEQHMYLDNILYWLENKNWGGAPPHDAHEREGKSSREMNASR